ncbi:LamG domain-containing protein [Puia dinghuensis]|nr:LamG domain-containing protein [Puia dinghuensis]
MLKYLSSLLVVVIVTPLIFISVAPFSGCQKNNSDTVTVYKHDTTTIVKNDTVAVNDTLYDIASGLVAYYNFNGGSLHDSSGYKNDIIFNNATPTTDRFGHANNAYLFDGSTSYMQVHNSASLNPDNLTIYAIVKINGFYQGGCHGNEILGKGSPDNVNGFYVMRYSDTLNNCSSSVVDTQHEFAIGSFGDNNPQGSGAWAGDHSSPLQTSTWYKFAFTYDGATARFYVNGVLKGSYTKTVAMTDNAYDLFIGKHNDPYAPYWFNGVIDEIRIYNRALPQQAITQLVNQTK